MIKPCAHNRWATDAFQIVYAVAEFRILFLFKHLVGAMLQHKSCRHHLHCGDGGVNNRRRECLVFLFRVLYVIVIRLLSLELIRKQCNFKL